MYKKGASIPYKWFQILLSSFISTIYVQSNYYVWDSSFFIAILYSVIFLIYIPLLNPITICKKASWRTVGCNFQFRRSKINVTTIKFFLVLLYFDIYIYSDSKFNLWGKISLELCLYNRIPCIPSRLDDRAH